MPTKPKRVPPNTQLPKGGVLLRSPIKKEIGGWTEMVYDAYVSRHGIAWYRVRGGMCDHNSIEQREDWVADLPAGCVAVHDYNWQDHAYGFGDANYGSFDAAVVAIMAKHLSAAQARVAELSMQLDAAASAARIVSTAVGCAGAIKPKLKLRKSVHSSKPKPRKR